MFRAGLFYHHMFTFIMHALAYTSSYLIPPPMHIRKPLGRLMRPPPPSLPPPPPFDPRDYWGNFREPWPLQPSDDYDGDSS